MTKEKDPLADYFHDPDEEYREYKRKKRERLEREREEAQQSSNEQSEEEEEVCDGIIDPIGDWDSEVEAYIESDESNLESDEFNDEFIEEDESPFYEGFSRSEQEITKDYDEQLMSNKAVLELKRLHENMSNPEFADDVYDLEPMEIYVVDSATESLNEAVRFSRYRRSEGSLKKHDESNECDIKEFLDSSYTSREIEVIFHKLNYPEDYLWAADGWEIRYCEHIYDTSKDGPICTGNHYNDYDKVDVEDIDTWPLYNHEIVDVDVEMELSFKKLLDELMPVIGDGGFCMDINLQIPYSQLAKVSTFEIRLIAFLITKNIKPRVSITIRNRDADIYNKACFYLTYLKITKRHR